MERSGKMGLEMGEKREILGKLGKKLGKRDRNGKMGAEMGGKREILGKNGDNGVSGAVMGSVGP